MRSYLVLSVVCIAEICVAEFAYAGVLSDYAQGGNIEMRSIVNVGFYGVNHVSGTDSQSKTDIFSGPPTGAHTTLAAHNIVPAGTHHPQDTAVGATSFQANFVPGGVDTLGFDFSGIAKAQNAHNLFGNEADGRVQAIGQISWFVGFASVANKPVAGHLLLPGVPEMPEGVNMTVKLQQTNCCPPTIEFSAPHAPVEIDIWHAYGYILSVTLDIEAPFGSNANFSYSYPVQAITQQAGDYNHNLVIDAGDYVVWRKTQNQTGSGLQADGSGVSVGFPDGVVNGHDYTYWRSHYGDSFTSGSGTALGTLAAIPEPASVGLGCLVAVGLSFSRRSRT